MSKKVSLNVNQTIKTFLHFEKIIFEYKNIIDRDTINKNMIWIINNFVDNFKQDDLKDNINKVLYIDIDKIDRKHFSKLMCFEHSYYPLIIDDELAEKIDKSIEMINKTLSFKFNYRLFYIFVFLYHIKKNIKNVLKDILEFSTQEYFVGANKDLDLKEVIEMYNKILQKR